MGLDQLKSEMDSLLAAAPARTDHNRPRLPIDRVFTVSGFGTVVTGTLVDGRLHLGDELDLRPGAAKVRVRGLQQHSRKVEVAEPGSRVAVNVAGVEREDVRRGDVLAKPGSITDTRRVDARVRVLQDSPVPLRHGAHVLLHTGTAEVPARVIVLESEQVEPEALGWIQLYLEAPLAARPGDRFILRLPSPSATIAGGRLADVAPRRHPRSDASVPVSLERRMAGDVLQEELRKYPRGTSEAALLKASLMDATGARHELDRLEARRAGEWLFSLEAWNLIATRARHELQHHHQAHPLRSGMPREELKSRLGLAAAAFPDVLSALAEEGVLVDRSGDLALPGHRVELEAGPDGPAGRLLELLGRDPYAPPSLAEAMRESGAGPEVVRALAREGRLVRLSPEVAFTRAAYEAAVKTVREIVAEEQTITVASLRDRIGASRRPVLALLEYLDSQRVTRRVGDARVLRQ
jgi:selenocysteine-specific elongation factor